MVRKNWASSCKKASPVIVATLSVVLESRIADRLASISTCSWSCRVFDYFDSGGFTVLLRLWIATAQQQTDVFVKFRHLTHEPTNWAIAAVNRFVCSVFAGAISDDWPCSAVTPQHRPGCVTYFGPWSLNYWPLTALASELGVTETNYVRLSSYTCKKTEEILMLSEERTLLVKRESCNVLRKRRAISWDLRLLVMW